MITWLGLLMSCKLSTLLKSQAGRSVTIVSTYAAITGSTAQAGGQGLTTLSGSAVSGNVSDILSKQQECEWENFNPKPVQELKVSVDKKEEKVEKKVVKTKGGKHEAGNLAHEYELSDPGHQLCFTRFLN